jgi:hypothetical protein
MSDPSIATGRLIQCYFLAPIAFHVVSISRDHIRTASAMTASAAKYATVKNANAELGGQLLDLMEEEVAVSVDDHFDVGYDLPGKIIAIF